LIQIANGRSDSLGYALSAIDIKPREVQPLHAILSDKRNTILRERSAYG
jgi:hypothetical protein